jgi:hypothetical protein
MNIIGKKITIVGKDDPCEPIDVKRKNIRKINPPKNITKNMIGKNSDIRLEALTSTSCLSK